MRTQLFPLKKGYNLSQQALSKARSRFSTATDALPLDSHIITMYDDENVKIIKFTLPSDETETLMTNLFDLDETEFKDLYFRRWRIEVRYNVIKNKPELPCFGVFSENVIFQDFRISMYLANMAAIAKNEAMQR